jgi:predicted outer membrane protein
MAEDRAARGPVKDFGRALVLDHTNDYEELSNVAASTGYVIPKAIEKKNYRVITMLNHYQGRFFDRAFLARQASEHEKLMQAFKRECETTSNSIIKMYATNALPTISIHLYDAQALLYPRFRIIAK